MAWKASVTNLDGIDPADRDIPIDPVKMRAFLGVPKLAIEARETGCTCGPYRANNNPPLRKRREIRKKGEA